MKLYKFLKMRNGKITSRDESEWIVGEWRKTHGDIEIWKNGLHASKEPLDALSYVAGGDGVAIVEGKGDRDEDSDKIAFSEMRIIKAYKWTKKDSVALAIYSAELVLNNYDKAFPEDIRPRIKNYEKAYPNDSRPRNAIEAAKKWLNNPTPENASAAKVAGTISAKCGGEIAARGGARSPEWCVAWSAAEAAWRTARSSEERDSDVKNCARWGWEWNSEWQEIMSAARRAIFKKINTWMKKRINKLEVIK